MAPFLLTRIFDLVSSSMSASFARSFIAANNIHLTTPLLKIITLHW